MNQGGISFVAELPDGKSVEVEQAVLLKHLALDLLGLVVNVLQESGIALARQGMAYRRVQQDADIGRKFGDGWNKAILLIVPRREKKSRS